MPQRNTRVSVIDIKRDLPGAVKSLLDDHGFDRVIAAKPGECYVKVNAIDFKPYVYTSLEVTAEVIDYCKRAGAEKVFLMENSTQSNFTRLVFEVAGFTRLAREHGAEPLYLDEGRESTVRLPQLGYDVHVSRHVKHIIDNRDSVTYINVPRLKTHSMTVMTVGIKNQYGLVAHRDRSPDHNFRLHKKLADVYTVIQPDFTLVDGTVATIYGHYPPEALHKKALVPLNILVGGSDTVAVDTVCARILGYEVDEVGHLREARDAGLGCADLDRIEITGGSLDRFKQKYPYKLYDAFPHDVEIIRGTDRNCLEGCDANTLALLQVLYLDFEGKGDFTIVMGKGFDRKQIDSIQGRVLVAGPCACDEVADRLIGRLGRKSVFMTKECNDLASTTGALTKLMRVSPLKMVPINPLKSVALLAQARLNRTKARIPPLIP
ncbi:MAG: DUF362 domain-containing protein [Candidatus Geothermincolia bacterium]